MIDLLEDANLLAIHARWITLTKHTTVTEDKGGNKLGKICLYSVVQ